MVDPKFKNIPVLVYHKLAVPSCHDANPNTCVTPSAFAAQMRLLYLLGYRTPAPAEYLKHRLGLSAALPPKSVLITFDDAFSSVLETGLPVMKAYGFTAAVFMIASAFGGSAFWDGETRTSPNRLFKADELKRLLDEGWAIGSHGLTHRDFRRLAKPDLEEEAAVSKAALESALGAEVSWFAYPYGAYTPEAGKALGAAGYKLAFATEEGDGGNLSLPRRIISGRNGLVRFFLRLRQAAGLPRV